MNEVTEINLAAKQVKTTDHVFPYDFLVLVIGSASHFFGITGAAEYAFQLKTLEQAIALRNHIYFALNAHCAKPTLSGGDKC